MQVKFKNRAENVQNLHAEKQCKTKTVITPMEADLRTIGFNLFFPQANNNQIIPVLILSAFMLNIWSELQKRSSNSTIQQHSPDFLKITNVEWIFSRIVCMFLQNVHLINTCHNFVSFEFVIFYLF